MPYRSTRDTRGEPALLTFEEAVITGLAPDGGLYIPTEIPSFSVEKILSWAHLPFHELAFHLFRPFIESPASSPSVNGQEIGIPDQDLKDILKRSFASFSHPEVTPVKNLPHIHPAHSHPVPDAEKHPLHVLELFHGPTFAFKDVALQVLGNLFEYFLARKNRSVKLGDPVDGITVLGATSGDTGGAAIYGLRGKKNVNVFILHPKHRISPVQEQQMTSVLDPNVHNVALDGSTFDDCQETVKVLFGDAEFKAKYKLGAINSINWARILAQTSYYFSSFLQLCRTHKKKDGSVGLATADDLPKIQYSVPTGNFGDVLAGYYALRMGLPIHKLIVATNENDILHRFWESGAYQKPGTASDPTPGSGEVKMTLSPAMDILVSSNFERLLWYLARGDSVSTQPVVANSQLASQSIVSWMHALKDKGGFAVPSESHALSKEVFLSRRVSDAATTDAIRRYYNPATPESSYILDPHTAVAVVAAEEVLAASPVSDNKPLHTIVLSTASPGKFPEAVFEATKTKGALKYEEFAPVPLVEQAGLPKRCVDIITKGDRQLAVKFVRKVLVETVGSDF
ncbi:threonine synthase [Phlyctochytrium planicorne]|nr:threonine synthase [Phlyctochytrium planicorne]